MSVTSRPCPICWQDTDDIPTVEIQVVLCLIHHVQWWNERIVGCPGCLRRRLIRAALRSLYLTNIISPVVLCMYAVEYWKSFRVASVLPVQERSDDEWQEWMAKGRKKDRMRVVALIVVSLIGVGLFLVVLWWAGAINFNLPEKAAVREGRR